MYGRVAPAVQQYFFCEALSLVELCFERMNAIVYSNFDRAEITGTPSEIAAPPDPPAATTTK